MIIHSIYVFLNFVYKYFIENFSNFICLRNWFVHFCCDGFLCIFIWFWCQCDAAFALMCLVVSSPPWCGRVQETLEMALLTQWVSSAANLHLPMGFSL